MNLPDSSGLDRAGPEFLIVEQTDNVNFFFNIFSYFVNALTHFCCAFFLHNMFKSEKLPTQENQHNESLGMTGQKIVQH